MDNILHYIDRGGIIVLILIGFSLLGWTLMLWKWLILAIAKRRYRQALTEILGVVRSSNQEYSKSSLQNALNRYIQKLESGLTTIKIIATTSPMLGLLGTVTGILSSFEMMASGGLGDPSLFASGISVALITTIAGLIVAIPHYIGYNYLISMLDSIEIDLEQKVLEQL